MKSSANGIKDDVRLACIIQIIDRGLIGENLMYVFMCEVPRPMCD